MVATFSGGWVIGWGIDFSVWIIGDTESALPGNNVSLAGV
jgi:hypothetical protein